MSDVNNYLSSIFFGATDFEKFCAGLQMAIHQIPPAGIYAGDNLFTFGRNLGFMNDEALMKAYRTNATTAIEQALLWRYSTIAWGFRKGLQLDGDFVECACYKGTTAKIMCDMVDFSKHSDRHYYLYDLFEHDSTMPHHGMPEHSQLLFQQTKERFSHFPNVIISKGRVPEILLDVSPRKIAFMHIDLNNAAAEIGALELLFDRMVPGAVLILDDYGWLAYRDQKKAEDLWLAERGYHVLELPTGQGLVIK
ncbi:TylF/MycF family methyltransferase [Deefgea tanakiae]|uniref:TylF/MycF family methyltransferase n=1 Tax=Deefgea tanakiae TaxID=2865840 RepID=A0ABX8Z9E8_9NEIS|nr:TylF/MycF/NovP-related O-methyltransferase [Deefgea tanakiae]QZA79207.1 TylF/MycF family methyltransferase [Deefgea tanakiae]